MIMLEFKCDKCQSDVSINFMKTVEVYADELGYRITKGENILLDTIQDYLVYTCIHCYEVYKLTLKDLESRIRRDAAQLALERRRNIVFNNQLTFDIDDNTSLQYCGLCGGVDNDHSGMCIDELMKICSIRVNHLERKNVS